MWAGQAGKGLRLPRALLESVHRAQAKQWLAFLSCSLDLVCRTCFSQTTGEFCYSVFVSGSRIARLLTMFVKYVIVKKWINIFQCFLNIFVCFVYKQSLQTGLELTVELRMALNSCFWFYLPNDRIRGVSSYLLTVFIKKICARRPQFLNFILHLFIHLFIYWAWTRYTTASVWSEDNLWKISRAPPPPM